MKRVSLPLSLLFTAVLCLSHVFAQTPPPALPLTGKIAHVTITGTEHITVSAVRAVLSLKPGDAYTPAAAAKDVASIKSLGVFNTVSAAAVSAPPGIDLTYTVVENPVVTAIKITADTPDKLPSVPAADLIAQMKTPIGQVLNTTVLVQDVNALFNHSTGYFWKQGYLTDVNNDINIEPKNGVLTIPLNEYRVHSIKITGNSRVKTADILAQMHTKIGDIYNYNALRRDEYSIYEMGGFKQVGDLTYDSTPPGKIDITLPVVEQAAATGVLDEKQGKAIPFTYDPLTCPFPVIQVSVNGKPPLPFMVDTGTSAGLTLDSWAVEKLGLKADDRVQQNINGVPYQQIALQGAVLQGTTHSSDVVFNTQEAYILDLGLLSQMVFNQRVAGIVGLGMLASSTSRFDFAAKTLTIFSGAHPPLSIAGRTVLPLYNDAGGALTVRASLAPDMYANLMVDTGSTSTQLPLSALRVAHPTAIAFNSIYARLDGIYNCPTLRLPALLLGKLSVPNIAVGTLPPPTRLSLGMNILAGYRMTLDCPNAQLILEPSATGGRYLTGYSGLDVKQKGDAWQVVWLQDQSPAPLAGLRKGDLVEAVNGISVKGLSQSQINRLLSGIVGRPQRVAVRRPGQGKSTEIVWVPADEFSATHQALYGMVMQKAPQAPWVVMDVIKGCPGSLAGLAAGDKITQMGGADTATMPMNQYVELLGNTSVVLEIERTGVARLFTVRLSAAK